MKRTWAVAVSLLASAASAAAVMVEDDPWGRMTTGWAVLTRSVSASPYDSADGATDVGADYAACLSMHPGARTPSLPERMTRKAVLRCRSSFALMHSAATRTPLWVSERLTKERIALSRRMERVDDFKPDESLSRKERSDLKDYARSSWDRGHMAPNGDMPDDRSQEEAFLMSNIVPQAPRLNRGSWSQLESDIRRYVTRTGPAYVVTGVLFDGPTRTLPGGRVAIPTSIWKAVLSPGLGSVVMVARNAKDGRPVPLSTETFRIRTGIDPFPAITVSDRARTIDIDAEDAR